MEVGGGGGEMSWRWRGKEVNQNLRWILRHEVEVVVEVECVECRVGGGEDRHSWRRRCRH